MLQENNPEATRMSKPRMDVPGILYQQVLAMNVDYMSVSKRVKAKLSSLG